MSRDLHWLARGAHTCRLSKPQAPSILRARAAKPSSQHLRHLSVPPSNNHHPPRVFLDVFRPLRLPWAPHCLTPRPDCWMLRGTGHAGTHCCPAQCVWGPRKHLVDTYPLFVTLYSQLIILARGPWTRGGCAMYSDSGEFQESAENPPIIRTTWKGNAFL